ncbi:MAG: response regulator, partial [Gammaproteobacteria bacterium TMED225]
MGVSVNILVIEDEPDIRKNLEYNLSRENYTVTSVSSLSEAESVVNLNKFSLILLDLMLPDG